MLSFRSTGVLGRIIEASFSKRKIDTRPPPFSLVPPINVENILFCFARLEDRHRKTIELSENYPGVVQRWKRDDKGKWKRIRGGEFRWEKTRAPSLSTKNIRRLAVSSATRTN